ncbi:MAG: hypothetical protein FJ387_10810 [Verrucomicrobia bacterium]|nr:hypothetical protein [Verrucomicrobiota bacterium]
MNHNDPFNLRPPRLRRRRQPQEWKVTSLRECLMPEDMHLCDTPERAVAYWRTHVQTHPHFNPDCECLVVLVLNTRRRVKGHHLVSIGTMDSILVHPREVYRVAIAMAASAVLGAHNHPSGEPQPSEGDIKVTRELIRAGQILRIEFVDHIIVGNPGHLSLRNAGYFFE